MSLLLDALKKAALDKQLRDKQVVSNSISADKNVPIHEDDSADEDVRALVSHDLPVDEPKAYNEGEDLAENDENASDLEFNEEDFEELEEDPKTETQELSIEEITETPEVQQEKQEPEYGRENLSLAVEQNLEPEPEPELTLGLEASQQKADREKAQELDARKQAMGSLIARNEAALKLKNRQRVILVVILALVAAAVVVSYYYYLSISANTNSLYVPQMQVAAKVKQEAEQEVEPSADTHGESSGEGEQLTSPAVEQSSSETQSDVLSPEKTIALAEAKPAKTQAIENAQVIENAQAIENMQAIKNVQPKAQTPIASENAPRKIKPNSAKPAPASSIENSGVVSKTLKDTSPLTNAIQTGYQAWQQGDWLAAQQAYDEALAIDPYHRDAVLGAAAIAAQLGKEGEALRFYQQRLARAPRDEFAISGILSIGSLQKGSEALESELTNLLREYPDAAHLHYLKGTVYASREQWTSAQSAFFEAWKRDATRPDYVFNLAVAMDHLGLTSEALQFYKQAQTLAQNHFSNFSQTALQTRLSQLQVQLQTPSRKGGK